MRYSSCLKQVWKEPWATTVISDSNEGSNILSTHPSLLYSDSFKLTSHFRVPQIPSTELERQMMRVIFSQIQIKTNSSVSICLSKKGVVGWVGEESISTKEKVREGDRIKKEVLK